MSALSQLPSLFSDIENNPSSSQLIGLLVRFTQTINSMNDDELVAFYQGLDLFQHTQPTGSILNRTTQYKMIQKIKKIAKANMKQRIDDCWGGSGRATLIHTFEKAVPNIY